MKKIFIVIAFLFSSSSFSADIDKQYKSLIEELRCMVCQNQNLSESEAPLAVDMKQKIKEMLKSGKNEEEIKLSLTGLWFRMNDKLQRVKTLLMTGRESAVKDEPLEDAYLDVSNYGIMATLVGRGKWGK